MDGDAGSGVWHALLAAVAAGATSRHGYTYALASQAVPETLTVWHNGRVILHTLANTGIPAAPTTIGTAPVYLRYTFQIMKGTNPDGSKYADPVSWVSYFRSGEAVHASRQASDHPRRPRARGGSGHDGGAGPRGPRRALGPDP
jgi:hypothetical protein